MKKVGLCVCYDTHNFGSQLQVLATIKAVEDNGYSTEIIRYKKKITPIFILQTIPRFFNPYFIKSKFGHKKGNIPLEVRENIRIREQRFEKFVDKYFVNLSDYYSGWKNLVKNSNRRYDMFLSGSDQLWLPSNLGSHFYTQEFVEKSKNKIAYATSFGVSNIPWFQKYSTRKYLRRFNYLSTREITGQEIIKNLTGKIAEVVLDPTLLFESTQWEQLIPQKKIIDKPYIFAYFLGTNPEHRVQAKKLQEITGAELITIPFLDNYVLEDLKFGDNALFDVDAEDFVNLIRDAEYIVTDSFHGSVFSIIHHKKFMTFNRFGGGANSRNSRIDSLCILLGLSDRRFDGDIEHIFNEIDYRPVDENISKLRLDSLEYLKKALEGQS